MSHEPESLAPEGAAKSAAPESAAKNAAPEGAAESAAPEGAAKNAAPESAAEDAAQDTVPTLQDAVLRLQRFWASKGCLRLPPCDFTAPFATLHPDAFFRILGPEAWRVAYVQPVRRPLDGRYGKHPYRLAKHHQLEVVLKPPPEDVQGLYLESLEALGFDLRRHDVRFTEWTWEPRSIGARGSGWHAVIDGLGVTRLTFLERLAGRDLDPLTVEISYGLERLLMRLQDVPSAFEVDWSNDGTDYGRLRHRDEEETSHYVCEVAGVGDLRQRLESLDRDAVRCLEAGLARPAYENAVRCLEPLDILEARGDMTARERSNWLEQIRQRVGSAADLHLARAADSTGPAAFGPSVPEPRQQQTAKRAQSPKRPHQAVPKTTAKTATKTAAKKKPARTRPVGKKPVGKKPARKRPVGKKPVGKKPVRKPSKPASTRKREADE